MVVVMVMPVTRKVTDPSIDIHHIPPCMLLAAGGRRREIRRQDDMTTSTTGCAVHAVCWVRSVLFPRWPWVHTFWAEQTNRPPPCPWILAMGGRR